VMTIFGGGRSIIGMLVAAAFLTGATEYLRSIGEYRMVAYGILILVVMIYLPKGIGPILEKIPHILIARLSSTRGVSAKRESET
jgi:branched-chain amino acid transport system permease protein